MVFTFEIIPLSLYGTIVFQLRIAFGIDYAQSVVDRYQIIEEKCIHSLALVFWQDAGEIQINHFGFRLQCLQEVNPSEGKEMPVCLLHRFRKAGKRNTESDHFIVCIPRNHRDQFITKHRDIHVDVIIDLLLSQG